MLEAIEGLITWVESRGLKPVLQASDGAAVRVDRRIERLLAAESAR